MGKVIGGTKGNKVLDYISGAPVKEQVIERIPDVFDYDQLSKYGYSVRSECARSSFARRSHGQVLLLSNIRMFVFVWHLMNYIFDRVLVMAAGCGVFKLTIKTITVAFGHTHYGNGRSKSCLRAHGDGATGASTEKEAPSSSQIEN